MKKKQLIVILLSTVTILIVVVAMLALMAETHPYPPGDWRYGIQSLAESMRMGLTREPTRRFEYALDVADYCLADLATAETPRQVDRAARQLARALDVAMAVINAAGDGVDESMLGALQILFIRANLVLAAMSGELATPTLVQLRYEINAALSGGGGWRTWEGGMRTQ